MQFNVEDIAKFKKDVIKALRQLAKDNNLTINTKSIVANLEGDTYEVTITFKNK